MTKGRSAPPRTQAQELEHQRRQALASLDVAALRIWMRQGGLESVLISDDDALVLRAAHEARVTDKRMPYQLRRDSRAWLAENVPDSTALLSDREIVGRINKR